MIMIDEKTAAGGVGRKVVEEFVACGGWMTCSTRSMWARSSSQAPMVCFRRCSKTPWRGGLAGRADGPSGLR